MARQEKCSAGHEDGVMKGSGTDNPPDCLACRHYFITYDPRQPRGCRIYGFKSRDLPSRVVLATSGMPCRLFTPRPAP